MYIYIYLNDHGYLIHIYHLFRPTNKNSASFPKAAMKIINKHGLEQAEFDCLVSKSKSNLLFRMRVLSTLRKIPDTR